MEKKTRMQFSFRIRNGADPRVIEFANIQSNFSDTVMYLIEKEIAQNGVRNLQKFIPLDRDILEIVEIERNVNARQQVSNQPTNYKAIETDVINRRAVIHEHDAMTEEPLKREVMKVHDPVFIEKPKKEVEPVEEKVIGIVNPVVQKVVEKEEPAPRKAIPSCYEE